MLNHYQIVEIVTIDTNIISRVYEKIITCTSQEYNDIVIPLYNKLAQSKNKYYSVTGSNKRVKYHGFIIYGDRVEDVIKAVNDSIKYNVKLANNTIDEHNRVCKKSNKLNNRDINENMIEHIKELDYLYIG